MSAVCPSWLSFILYNPVRKFLTSRQQVIEESGITADSVVLEVGAGNGFFTELLAQSSKKVIAIELQEAMVRKLEKRTHLFAEKVNIVTGDIADVLLEERVVDVCLMYYSFHEVGRKAEAAKRIISALKSNGIISIFEPTIEVDRTNMQQTVDLFERSGLKKEYSRDGFFTRFCRLRKTDAPV